MAWSGSGTYSRTNGSFSGADVWADDANAAIGIVASRHDTHDQDLAAGINACLTKNGENEPTANLPMGAFRHTNVAAASARTDYARYSQVQDGAAFWGGTSGGSANAQTVTLTPAITTLTAGGLVHFIPGFTNTGALTVTINGQAATARYKNQACVGGEVVSGVLCRGLYDGAYLQILEHGGGWATWSPTYGGSGSLTFTSVSTAVAQYQRHGSLIVFNLTATGTTGGTTNTALTFTAPVSLSGGTPALAAYATDTVLTGGAAYFSSATTVEVKKADASNWGLAAGKQISVNGVYRV